MSFRPIVGTLAYLLDRQEDRVLMISRDARPDDDHYGKVNGLGGKLEADESVVAGMRREIQEEAGLELTSFSLRGTVTWTNFGPKREEWLAFIFLVDGWDGTPPQTNAEGTLLWVSRAALLRACGAESGVAGAEATAERAPSDPPLSMWAGDRHFVPLVFDQDDRAFHGTMPYDGHNPLSWSFERI